MLDIVRRKKGEAATSPIVRLQDEMNDLFGRFFNLDWPWETTRPGGWWPTLDVADKDDAVVVKVDVPGMKAQDIDISVQGNTLTITGERKDVREEKDGDNYYHCERRSGSFRRDITLPTTVEADKIEAQYRDGVLTVTMPKTEQAKPKRIAVKA
jgi:HSP20 family protein